MSNDLETITELLLQRLGQEFIDGALDDLQDLVVGRPEILNQVEAFWNRDLEDEHRELVAYLLVCHRPFYPAIQFLLQSGHWPDIISNPSHYPGYAEWLEIEKSEARTQRHLHLV